MLSHLWQRFQDLLFGVIHILEKVDEKVLERFHFGHEWGLPGSSVGARGAPRSGRHLSNRDEPLTCRTGGRFPTLLRLSRPQLSHSWGAFAVDSHNPVKHTPKWDGSLCSVPEDHQRPRQ